MINGKTDLIEFCMKGIARKDATKLKGTKLNPSPNIDHSQVFMQVVLNLQS